MRKFSQRAAICTAAWLIGAMVASAQDQLSSWRITPAAQPDDYPLFAMEFGFSGTATLECAHDSTGSIQSCKVVSESPEGLGFGPAAVRIGRRGALNPPIENGVAKEGRFTFRIPFNLTTDEPAFKPLKGAEPEAGTLALAEQLVDRLGPLPPMYDVAAVQSLPADRQEIVANFIREAFPAQQDLRGMAAQGIARVFPATALKAIMEGRGPSEDDIRQIDKLGPQVFASLFDIETAKAGVRARYCARYDCGGLPQ